MLCIRSITTFSGIRALKEAGVITTGSFTSVHDKMILLQYQLLKTNTFVDEVSLKAELFAKGDRNRKDFMMQRQLVGFYLMQDLPDWERRLPIEVYGRLAVLLQSGTFTKEEDKAILISGVPRAIFEAGAKREVPHQTLAEFEGTGRGIHHPRR